jgi:hypothetical protein
VANKKIELCIFRGVKLRAIILVLAHFFFLQKYILMYLISILTYILYMHDLSKILFYLVCDCIVHQDHMDQCPLNPLCNYHS